MNAAYYPLQTRTWLTQGRLMYDDLPLIDNVVIRITAERRIAWSGAAAQGRAADPT